MKGFELPPIPEWDDEKMLEAYRRATDANLLTSITDRDGNILYVNELYCKVTKYKASELIGKNFRILKSGRHSREFYASMWETLLSGKTWTGELQNRAKDGTLFWVDTVILPVLDDNGEVVRFLSLRYQITYRKRIELERMEFTRELHDLVHKISHEIRAPIVGCQGILNIVDGEQSLNQVEIDQLVGYLKTNVEKLESYTRDLNDRIVELQNKYAAVLGV